MIKWLLLSALAVNLSSFFWFTSQGEVLSSQSVSIGLWQRDLAGEIVLLSELEVIPPTRSPPVVEGLLVENPLPESPDAIAVASIEPLSALGSVGLQVDVGSRPEFVASQQVSEGDNLQKGALVKEALRDQKNGFEARPIPIPKPEPKLQCVTLGGFDKLQDANGLLEKLQDTVGVTSKVNAVAEGLVRYLVYMPPFDTRIMAKEEQAELRDAGIRSSLYYKGDLKNGLSLGYFGSNQNAERRYKALLVAGYRVELKAVETHVIRYWVELQSGDDSRLSQHFWRDIAEVYPYVAKTEVDCSVVE